MLRAGSGYSVAKKIEQVECLPGPDGFLFGGLGDVNDQVSTFVVLAVLLLSSPGSILGLDKSDKTIAFGAAGNAVSDNDGFLDRAELRKQLPKFLAGDFVEEVADK